MNELFFCLEVQFADKSFAYFLSPIITDLFSETDPIAPDQKYSRIKDWFLTKYGHQSTSVVSVEVCRSMRIAAQQEYFYEGLTYQVVHALRSREGDVEEARRPGFYQLGPPFHRS
jgi:hypothetical protein